MPTAKKTVPILKVVEVDFDDPNCNRGRNTLQLISKQRVTITLHGIGFKNIILKNEEPGTCHLIIVEETLFYDANDSYSWGNGFEENGSVKLVAEVVGPNRAVAKEEWTIHLAGHRAVRFEKLV